MSNKGILVAADEKLEWLLPWWWARYSAQNDLPVAFVDLGMSHFGKTFCQEQGILIPLEMEKEFTKRPIDANKWEELFGKQIWENRKSWFKKPFALLSSPFSRTLWLDLDCEVLKPLNAIFELSEAVYLARDPDSAHARERSLAILEEGEVLYNTGVILYSKGEKLIEKWIEAIQLEGDQFCSDQHALSKIIYKENIPVQTLSPHYNWRITQGLNLDAIVIHWVGSWGKEYIRRYGGIAAELQSLIGSAPGDYF